MDPLTLFALANGAVAAVKKGCALYKEIQGVAGDVKGVLADLDQQFGEKFKDKKPTVAEKNQYIEEKNRIVELSKQQPDDIYTMIGEELGAYFENYAKCSAIFEEETKHDNEVYIGDTSLGKRALQRVLMESKLVSMQAELRELMVYNCPAELGDLYSRVEKMMQQMKKQQAAAWAAKKINDRKAAARKARNIEIIKEKITTWSIAIFCILYLCAMLWSIVEIRKSERPEFGTCWVPKGQWPYEYYSRLKWIDCEK